MSLLKVNTVQTDTLKSIAGVNRNSVLQVVSKVVSTQTTATSESFIDVTDMFLAITPTSGTSKILCMFDLGATASRSSAVAYVALRLLRDSTVIHSPYTTNAVGSYTFGVAPTGATAVFMPLKVPINFLDSPATTNEIVYKLQTAVYDNANSGQAIFNGTAAGSATGLLSTITLMEIAQ